MRKLFFSAIFMMASVVVAMAANVKVTMNAISTTMTLADKATGDAVAIGKPTNKVYDFAVNAGTYILTAYDTDSTTVNGTIEFTVADEDLALKVFTLTAYATNKEWEYGTDYTINYQIISKEGVAQTVVMGNSKTAGRKTVLALEGHTYYFDYVPSAARQVEGFTTGYKTGTINSNVTASMAIPEAQQVVISAPADATVFVGRKTAHFVAFIEETPVSVEGTTRTYNLAKGSEYNYRVSKAGGLTQGGVFKADGTDITITEADFTAKSPKWIDRDVKSNGGYNVADIFLNINAQEHLKLAQGQTYDLIALRNWEVINSITANYFIEPDYHYTVTDINGVADDKVVTIDADGTLHAVGNGTAIVTVTYDAIRLIGMTGGEYWSAIWPENTGVFVVTVGDAATGIETGMTINETNTTQYKLAGTAYDADFDVFYFIDTEDGYDYTFKPSNVASVKVAYPAIGENAATYNGFGTEGVTYNAETEEYTVRVKNGRQIVQLTNESGVSEYQVLVGKPVHIEAIAAGREQTGDFFPGDKITVQLTGLYHPANKLAGVHNFQAFTIYQHDGAEIKSSSNQYTFCSTPAAQAVTVTLPEDFDLDAANNQYVLTNGVIRVSGFGDPIGNHRNTSKKFGRGANFTAVNQQAVFGALPQVTLTLRERPAKQLSFVITPADADIKVTDYAGKELVAAEGVYDITTADYNYEITKAGYKTVKATAKITESSEAMTTINVALEAIDAEDTGWDGLTTTYAPEMEDEWYIIRSGYQMAWFANQINGGNLTLKAKLANNISLNNYEWTPAGGSTAAKAFNGQFDGQGNAINGLFINTTTTYQALFGYVQNGAISNLTVTGEVTTTGGYASGIAAYLNASTMTNCVNRVKVQGASNVGGVAGYTNGATTIDRCGNEATVTATGNYAGGITANTMNKSVVISNCYNIAAITGVNYVAGISANMQQAATVKNVFNIGAINGTGANVGAIRGHATNGTFENILAVQAYAIDETATVPTTILTADEFANGKAARILADAFGQTIGTDAYPVLGGATIYEVNITENENTTITYMNETTLPDTVWINNIYGAYFNAEGQKVTAVNSDTALNLMIDVKPLTGAATFEERTLKDEVAWYGDPDFEDEDNDWNSGDYVFSTYVDNWGESGIFYYDITMANLTGKTFSWTNPYYDQYSAAGGAAEGENYAIWYNNWFGNANVTLATPQVVSGMAVTNNAWVVDNILNGDGMSIEEGGATGLPFGKGDWLLLTVTGFDAEGEEVGKVNYYLADFRDTNVNYDWTYAENWQWLDLTSLGTVSELGFSLSSSKRNNYGMTTAAYFCFDNLGGNRNDCRLGEMTHIKGMATDIVETENADNSPRKVLNNGNVMIIRNGHIYHIDGVKVK